MVMPLFRPLMARATAAARPLLRRPLSTAAPKSYSEKMDATGRPVSPHLFIYRFPTIAISSITVRITGVLLTVGASGVASMALLGGVDAPGNVASAISASSVGPLAKFTVGFSLVYHYLGACRHIFWDKTAKGFSNAQMLQSSYALFGAATAISVGLACVSLKPKPKKE